MKKLPTTMYKRNAGFGADNEDVKNVQTAV